MRRLFYLELRRVVTTRTTWVLMTAIILLSAVMAYFPVSFVSAYQTDGQGNVTKLKGTEAIRYLKESEAGISGEITEEKLRQAILSFQECYRQYGSAFPPELPMEIYAEKIEPYYPVLKMAAAVLAPEGVWLETMTDADISPEDVPQFYEKYRERMTERGKTEEEQERIRKLNEEVKTPFTYVSGFSSESLDYLILYFLLMLFAIVMILCPVFSAEYQTGADSILRCTKYGRIQLAVVKAAVSVMIFAVIFLAGTGIFLLVTNLVFGTEGLKTSVQMINSVFVIPALTAGQTQAAAAGAGFLSLLSTAGFTLFLSARCGNVQDTMKIALPCCLLPTIIYMLSSANVANIVRALLPSGGLGLMNSFLYELLGNNFAHIGPFTIWMPHLILGAAVAEIPLFFILAVRTYCRREA